MNTREALKCIRAVETILRDVKYESDPILKFLDKLHAAGFWIEVDLDCKAEVAPNIELIFGQPVAFDHPVASDLLP